VEKTIKVINELKNQGLIEDYAIGGGIGSIFYIEPVLTFDLDVLILIKSEGKIITLSPIYDYLKRKGYRAEKEHIIIEGVPVQFIPAYNELVKEAVEKASEVRYKGVKTRVLTPEYLVAITLQTKASEVRYKGVKTRVLTPEYLVAIMLQTYRPKDRERIIKFLEEAKVNLRTLSKILQKHKLKEKYEQFLRTYYGKK